jgi:type I restriction enzyme S subunit
MDTKALRQKILDLAIRGKLVPQDPNDEPASVLLERIRAEKQQMVKDGKLKPKDIKNDTIIFVGEDNLHYEKFQDGSVKCIEDEIPFEVPEGWAWCRLKHVCTMAAGKAKPTDQIMTEPFEGCYPCFGGNGIRGYVDEYNQDGIFSIVGRQGALCGNINIAKGKFYATEHAVVTTLFSGIDFNWSNYVLEALQLNSYATGAAQPGLSVANVLNVFVPVPPTQEQVHIGIRIAESIKIIENIEDEKENLQTLISSAKSKILDLAIRGQLVPQNPNDEPASVLLERIRAEKEELIKAGKIKRDKKESIIFRGEDNSYYEKIGNKSDNIDENIPFEIPVTWNWCRGYTCFAGMESQKPTDKFFDYIDIDSIDNHNHKIKKPKHLPASDAPSRASRAVQTGSVLFSLVRPYLENIALIEEKNANSIASTGFYVCNSAGVLYSEYMFFLMISGYVVSGLNQFMKGDNSPSISKDNIESWLYPIPPYEEQKVICKKIKSIFSKIEAIEKSLS